jgi:hypothetical protein
MLVTLFSALKSVQNKSSLQGFSNGAESSKNTIKIVSVRLNSNVLGNPRTRSKGHLLGSNGNPVKAEKAGNQQES